MSDANRAVTAAAREPLLPLGLKQHGRSRKWLDDRGSAPRKRCGATGPCSRISPRSHGRSRPSSQAPAGRIGDQAAASAAFSGLAVPKADDPAWLRDLRSVAGELPVGDEFPRAAAEFVNRTRSALRLPPWSGSFG